MGNAIRRGARRDKVGNGVWKLEDAKARFSEVVRLAQSHGPQRVTVRGRETVVIMSVEELERMAPAEGEEGGLIPFLENLGLAGLDVDRERDIGRDISL